MDRYRQIRPEPVDVKPSESAPSEIPDIFPRTHATFSRTPVPESARFASWMPPQSPANSKFCKVALVGPPNSGKSSLLNAICGHTIAAVSPKVNTTCGDIRGVRTERDTQVCFVDAPGIIPASQRKVARELVSKAWNGYNEADVALLVIDTVKRPDQQLFDLVRSISPIPDIDISTARPRLPVILVLNKIDKAEDNKWVVQRSQEFLMHGRFEKIFFISAKQQKGVQTLWTYLKQRTPLAPWMFPADMITSLSQTEQVEQLIRTFLFCWFNQDVPYRVEQQTVGWTERVDGTLVVEQELVVKDSVVARLILGVRNALVYRMSAHVQRYLEGLWQRPVKVLIWVKPLKQRQSFHDKQQLIAKAKTDSV